MNTNKRSFLAQLSAALVALIALPFTTKAESPVTLSSGDIPKLKLTGRLADFEVFIEKRAFMVSFFAWGYLKYTHRAIPGMFYLEKVLTPTYTKDILQTQASREDIFAAMRHDIQSILDQGGSGVLPEEFVFCGTVSEREACGNPSRYIYGMQYNDADGNWTHKFGNVE